MAGKVERLAEHREELRRGLLGVLVALDVGKHEGELVTAETRKRVAVAHVHGEAAGNGPQRLVANAVTVGVVDLLEVVEVHEQHGDGPAAARALGEMRRGGGRGTGLGSRCP